MKTNKKACRGGVLLLALILVVNILIPTSAWAAGAVGGSYISIDGTVYEAVNTSTLTWESVTSVRTVTTSIPITFSDDGHVVFQGKYLTIDGITAIKKTDNFESGLSESNAVAYTTMPIPLDFTAPESLSMRATQGSSELTIDPCVITNTRSEDLKLSQVEITAASGWTVVNASTDFTTAESKNKIAFTAGSHDFSGGAYTPNEKIAGGSSTTLQLAGKISEKADLTNATQVASMVITVEKAVNLISFTIDDTYGTVVTYQAEEGMTWEEWVASGYNTDGFYVKDNWIYRSSWFYVGDENSFGSPEEKTALIKAGRNYILDNSPVAPPA